MDPPSREIVHHDLQHWVHCGRDVFPVIYLQHMLQERAFISPLESS